MLILTDSDNEDNLYQAIRNGAKGYLHKSGDFAELTDAIRLVATGKTIVYSSTAGKLTEPSGEKMNRTKDLSDREKEILSHVAHGSSSKEIASSCYIRETTVKAHLRRISEKLNVRNRVQAVAVAIENALKFSQEAAILEATSPLYRASRGIALATGLDDVLMAIVDHVAGPYVDRCTINLFTYPTEDQELAWLEAAAVWDRASDAPNLPGTRYPLDAESLEHMRQRGMEPLVVNDLQTAVADERLGDAMRLILTESLQLRAVLFLPLVAAGRLVGLLIVASRQPHTWTEAELRTFRSLSTQVASAVENARLFQQTQARAARERALNQMMARFARSFDIDTVLQTAVRELGQLPHVAEVSVHMGLPEAPSPANGGEEVTQDE
jgi:GAF domain-containing protein/DNA-binding CsgD family transcriptional regulator